MKIKLSKSQWESMGRKAGWMRRKASTPELSKAYQDALAKILGQPPARGLEISPQQNAEIEKVQQQFSQTHPDFDVLDEILVDNSSGKFILTD